MLDLQLVKALPNGMSLLKATARRIGANTLREIAGLTPGDIEEAHRAAGRVKTAYRGAGNVEDFRRLLALAGLRLRGE